MSMHSGRDFALPKINPYLTGPWLSSTVSTITYQSLTRAWIGALYFLSETSSRYSAFCANGVLERRDFHAGEFGKPNSEQEVGRPSEWSHRSRCAGAFTL